MKVRVGFAQRLNIGDYESVEIHVELEEDVNEVNETAKQTYRRISQELTDLAQKECITRLSEVQARRNGDTPAGELQSQVRASAPRK